MVWSVSSSPYLNFTDYKSFGRFYIECRMAKALHPRKQGHLFGGGFAALAIGILFYPYQGHKTPSNQAYTTPKQGEPGPTH